MNFTTNLLMTKDKFMWVKLDPLKAAKLFKKSLCPMYEVWEEDGNYSESQLQGNAGLDDLRIGELVEYFDSLNFQDSFICIELEDYMKLVRTGYHHTFLN